MRKSLLLVFVAVFGFVFSSAAFGEEKATPAEVVTKVKEALQLIKEKGADAYPIIRDKKGPFVWKDTYVFVGDLEGNLLVHINDKLEGRNMMGAKDATGKLFHAELINGVKKSPDGFWQEYQWVKPGEKQPSAKVSYQMGVPGTNIFTGAGVWDVTLEQVKQAIH
jgi:cytochrome c